MTRHYRILFLVIALSSVAVVSWTTTIRRYTLDEVRDNAEIVFTGHVVSSAPLPVMDGQLIATRYTVAVEEVLQGTAGKTTTITYLGAGQNGAPALLKGKRYLFFKTGQPNDTTVGWGQGLYEFETVATAGGSRTILVSGDGEPLVLQNGKLARGSRVAVAGGHLTADTMASSEPQDAVTAFNADGSPAPRVAAPRTIAAAPSFATFNDLRRFVASGHGRNR